MNKNILLIILLSLGMLAIAFLYFDKNISEQSLEKFATLTESDPLFYSPFFDHEAFATSLEALKKSEDALKSSIIANITAADAEYTSTFVRIYEEHDLFPHDFLKELGSVSLATEAFLEDRSTQNAEALIASYERASDAYLASAQSGTAVFDAIDSYTRSNRSLLYFFVDSFTSTNLVRSDYELIEKNALALIEEVERRKDCLYGKNSCEGNSKPKEDDFFTALSTTTELTSSEALFTASTLPGQSGQNDLREVRGPYPATSSCWGEDNGSHWLYLVYITREGRPPYVMPKLVDQNYYRIVYPSSTDPISEAVRSRGLSFYSQLETTTYECTDLTFYPRLLALDLVKKHAEENQVSEAELANDPRYQLFAENQFGVLGPALSVVSSYTDILEASQHTSNNLVISPQFLFTTRSAYSLTFMPFARSIWRIEETPRYLHPQEDRAQTGMRDGFMTYTELKAKNYSDEAIRAAHLNQQELINSVRID